MSKNKSLLACDYCGLEKPARYKWFTIGWRLGDTAPGQTRPPDSRWRFCSWEHLKAFATADGIKLVDAKVMPEHKAKGRDMFPELTSRGDEPE